MTKQDAKFDLYIFHRSYFCGKMMAYMRYKEIPCNTIYATLAEHGNDIAQNTGLRQMPCVKTPEGEWMQDTTPMIEWFETRFPQASVLPVDPVARFLTRLMEDYADEWMWRPAIHYRWMTKGDRTLYRKLFVDELLGGFWAIGGPISWLAGKLIHRHQEQKFLSGDGMTNANTEHVESTYINTLDRLEAIFQKQPYLLGNHPSLADFGFFGSMFWHFSNDPTSNRIMQERAPGVYEWVARLWNATSTKLGEVKFDRVEGQIPEGWEPLLTDACEAYLPYLSQNAKQFEKGRKRFDWDIQGYRYPGVHVSPYRVWCRERLQGFLNNMSEVDQNRVRAILEPMGGWEPLTSNPHIASNWDPEGIAPMCRPQKLPFGYTFKSRFTGSNHVRTRRAWVKD